MERRARGGVGDGHVLCSRKASPARTERRCRYLHGVDARRGVALGPARAKGLRPEGRRSVHQNGSGVGRRALVGVRSDGGVADGHPLRGAGHGHALVRGVGSRRGAEPGGSRGQRVDLFRDRAIGHPGLERPGLEGRRLSDRDDRIWGSLTTTRPRKKGLPARELLRPRPLRLRSLRPLVLPLADRPRRRESLSPQAARLLSGEKTKDPPGQQLHPAFTMALLSRLFDWKSSLVVLQPETLLRWQRSSVRFYWRWKSRTGKPKLPIEVRDFIRRASRENPTWGEERIRDELRVKFGIKV